jgi:glyoxalase family protein
LTFEDPDGLPISLIIPKSADLRKPWETEEVSSDVAIKGFHSITLTLTKVNETANILTDIFDYEFIGQEGNRFRYRTRHVDTANIVDLVQEPAAIRTGNGGGIIHHVAFRVKNEKELMEFREKIAAAGFNITPKKDRNYFLSLYFREPGGVLFEIATDTPGFSIDEDVSELGRKLMLPSQFESQRREIEAVLPALV